MTAPRQETVSGFISASLLAELMTELSRMPEARRAANVIDAAACATAHAAAAADLPEPGRSWPFDLVPFEPQDRRGDLVRAGAYVLAALISLDGGQP